MTQDNFPYAVTASAPKEYPIEVHIGYLADEKNNLICGIPKAGMENGSWQYDGTAAGMGSTIAPSHINLIYVAYAEKKFYQLDADLPKEKILEAIYDCALVTPSFFSSDLLKNSILVKTPAGRKMLTRFRLRKSDIAVEICIFCRKAAKLSTYMSP